MTSLRDRFFAKVGSTDDCWEWTAHIDPAGYGRIGDGRRGVLYAHRVSFELHFGPIPPDRLIDHKCRNRGCVNPDHLQAVTHKQNLENLAGANRANKSTGIRNVYLHKASGRFCVRVGHNGQSIHGGYFATVEEADRAARELRARLFTNNLADQEKTA